MLPPSSLRACLYVLLLFSCPALASAKTLKIISTPPGATVELEGKVVGVTPYEQDFPSGFFQRPMTSVQKRLEHPVRVRLTLTGYVTQELVLTIGPKDWLDLHRRSHGSYWLFKSDQFQIDLPPLPPSTQGVSSAGTFLFPAADIPTPLPLPPPSPCASIPLDKKSGPGIHSFLLRPAYRDPGRAALSFKTKTLTRRRPAPAALSGGPSPGDLVWSHLRGGLS